MPLQQTLADLVNIEGLLQQVFLHLLDTYQQQLDLLVELIDAPLFLTSELHIDFVELSAGSALHHRHRHLRQFAYTLRSHASY